MNAIAKHMLYYVLLAAVGLCVYLALSGHAQAAETAVTSSQGLEGALVDIIQQVSGGVKQGVDFLQAEIPDVIRQLLMWKLAEAAVCATMLFLLGLGIICGFVKACKWSQREGAHHNDEAAPFFTGLFGGIALIFITGFCITHALTALKIYIAPKVWLIEYAASLVK